MVVLLTFLVAITACGPKAEELVPLPALDLEGAEVVVRDHLATQQRAVEELLENGDLGPDLAEAYGDFGALLIAYGFNKNAVGCLSNAAVLDDSSFRWAYLHAFSLQESGLLREAASELARAAALDPEDLPCRIRLGRVLLQLNELEGAGRAFERASGIDPEAAAAFEGRGDCAVAAGDHEAAVAAFESALERQPDATSLHHRLALARQRLGAEDEAEHHRRSAGEAPVLVGEPLLQEVANLSRSVMSYRERAAEAMARNRPAQAAPLYLKALEIAPQDVRALWEHGLCLERLGDGRGALYQLNAALAAAAKAPEDLSMREFSGLHQSMAGVFARLGLNNESLQHLEEARRLDPSNQAAVIQKAATLASMQRLDEALDLFDGLLAETSDDWRIFVQRGSVLVGMGRRARGLEDFRHAVELAPDSPEARLHLAEALEFGGDLEGAEAARRQALELEDSDVARAQLLLREAQSRIQRGDFPLAIERCREAVGLAPDLAEGRYLLGSVLGHVGRLDEALREFDEVLSRREDHAQAHLGRVTILLLGERWAEARSGLERMLEFAPQDRRPAHALARLLASAPDESVRDGARALELADAVLEMKADLAAGETLAMAYAEAGDVTRAMEIQRRVVAEARAGRDSAQRARAERQLERYLAGEPWRAPSPDAVIQGTLIGG